MNPLEYEQAPDDVVQPGVVEYQLYREGADWGTDLVSGWGEWMGGSVWWRLE